MSLDVAIQSVAFYVLSCSTCSKISHRRKAKVQAKKERAEKQALETEQPGLYRHPSPFSTNPYWTEEIMMGPGPPKKKGDRSASKNTSQRALNTAGQGSSYAGSTGMSTEAPSSPTAVTEGSRLSGDDWNRKRYQREDEALWGIDFQGSSQKIKEVIAKAGESAGRLVGGRLSISKSGPIREQEEEYSGPYYLNSRNPPVNDLHPPIVSTQPQNRGETKWMLQPPPSAKVMEGKVRVHSNRSRASSGSTLKNTLSRQATERTFDSKLQRADTPSSRGPSRTESRTESRTRRSRRSRPRQQRHDSYEDTSSDELSETTTPSKKKKIPMPLSIPTASITSQATAEHVPIKLPTVPAPVAHAEMTELPKRPLLTTIVSSSNDILKAPGTEDHLLVRELSVHSANSRPSTPSQKLTSKTRPRTPGVEPEKSNQEISTLAQNPAENIMVAAPVPA